MSCLSRITDAEDRAKLTEAHRQIVTAHALVRDVMAGSKANTEALMWADHNLIDAGSDIAGIVNDGASDR